MNNNKKISKGKLISLLLALALLTILLTGLGIIFINIEFNSDAFEKLVEENYILGAAMMIFICAIQVIIAFIPGELLEIAAGYAFGAVFGTIYCLAGILIGSTVALLLARKFGRRFVEVFYPPEKIDSLPILNNPKKRNFLIAILFFIPGTPKDLLTYIIGLTNVSIPLYLALTGISRLPSIIMSTLGGGALGDNSIISAIIIFAISAILSAIGYLVYTMFFRVRKRKSETNITHSK